MSRRMTIVFDDEDLYTQLKVEAARSHRPAKDLVAEALCLLFESTAEEHATIRARARTKHRGGAPVGDILQQLGLAKEASGTAAG